MSLMKKAVLTQGVCDSNGNDPPPVLWEKKAVAGCIEYFFVQCQALGLNQVRLHHVEKPTGAVIEVLVEGQLPDEYFPLGVNL